MSKPKMLDLFACAGGASRGYMNAGFDVIAVDCDRNALKHNPAAEHFAGDWKEGLLAYAAQAAFVHASPPCQGYIPNNPKKGDWPLLVPEVREALLATGKPFVIENVPTCEDLEDPVSLRGCAFNLTVKWDVPKDKVRPYRDGSRWEVIKGRKYQFINRAYEDILREGPVEFHVHRERKFEAHGFRLAVPPVNPEVHRLPALTVVSGTPTGFWNQWYGATIPTGVKREAMGIDWKMGGHDVAESIPPAYAEYIGKEALSQLGYTQSHD